jgi:hypothetical protein
MPVIDGGIFKTPSTKLMKDREGHPKRKRVSRNAAVQ